MAAVVIIMCTRKNGIKMIENLKKNFYDSLVENINVLTITLCSLKTKS